MNAIDYVLNEINFQIPKSIRHYAFVSLNNRFGVLPMSEQSIIRQRVIYNKLLVDCDLAGGEEAIIPFKNTPLKELEDNKVIYRIPKNKLQGRTITSVLSVSSGDHRLDTHMNNYYPSSALMESVDRIFDAATNSGGLVTNRVRLIGENNILLEDRLTYNDLYLRCILSYDKAMSNFSPKAFSALAHAGVLACKAIIYNDTILDIDASMLMGGVPIGRFKEVIDSYADASEMYREYLKTQFTKILMQQDKEAHSRHLRLLTNGI